MLEVLKRGILEHVFWGARDSACLGVCVCKRKAVHITLTEPNEIALERNSIYVTSYTSGFAFTNVIAEFPS